MKRSLIYIIFSLISFLFTTQAISASNRADAPGTLRVNRVGYLSDDIKTAIYLGDVPLEDLFFHIEGIDETINIDTIITAQPWEPTKYSAQIDFSSLTKPGTYSLVSENKKSGVIEKIPFYIGNDAYSRHQINEYPLNYLRQQRCGYNPYHDENCHQHDGILVLSGINEGKHYDVTGGWHDASDYLQYLTTSATTVYQLLFAYKQHPEIWADNYDAMGKPGANGIPDILDEAKWGLDWMIKMNPEDGLYFNQIADDRDHRFSGKPSLDNVDYGWGDGKERPIYPCSAQPYGLQKYKNESTGLASSVGKFASAFGLGAEILSKYYPEYANDLETRSSKAYEVAKNNPGACQTAPCVSPYYYEEDNWADDMELAAMTRYNSTGDIKFLADAVDYERLEPVVPWMGADSAYHYQWYPFINLGHYEIALTDHTQKRKEALRNIKSGLDRVSEKAKDNVFMIGIPFIWCSNNLATAFVTQAMLYRELTGDDTYRKIETMTRDWLFGLNPWDQIMIILPEEIGPSPHDAHSALTDMTVNGKPGREGLYGGLVDGPIYTEKFNSLWGVHLRNNDPYKLIQNPVVVYHDDYSDYSTNEPTMDGTASTTIFLGKLAAKGVER